MSIWFEFGGSADMTDSDEEWMTTVEVDAIEGAKALAREDEKSWAMLTMQERERYERMAIEAIVAMGGVRI